jgi:hypothetical protein
VGRYSWVMPLIHSTIDVATSVPMEEGAGYFDCPKTGARYLEFATKMLTEVTL